MIRYDHAPSPAPRTLDAPDPIPSPAPLPDYPRLSARAAREELGRGARVYAVLPVAQTGARTIYSSVRLHAEDVDRLLSELPADADSRLVRGMVPGTLVLEPVTVV